MSERKGLDRRAYHLLGRFVTACIIFFSGNIESGAVIHSPKQDGVIIARATDVPPQKKFKERQLLVKFRPTVSEDRKQNIHKKQRGRKIKEYPGLRLHQIELPADIPVEMGIRLYAAEEDVEYAEPNYLVHAAETLPATPDDPLFNQLWGLHNTGQNGGTAGADIGMPEAWKATTGSGEVVVAVLDTGIDNRHEDIAPNMWVNPYETANNADDDGNGYSDDIHGINAITGSGDSLDDYGHGTHVAGIIGAVGNNAVGVTGINWAVRIMACKFLDATGVGYVTEAVACLEYVRTMKSKGVNIVATNNSWGAAGFSRALYDAARLQMESGILLVAAAGNYGMDNDVTPFFPATYDLPNVLSVAAMDRTGAQASYSNFGRMSVHIMAPGTEIVSLRAEGTDIFNDGQHFVPPGDPAARYYVASGTSMAAPHVTGLTALIKAADPSRDWRIIKNLVMAGGRDTTSMAGKSITGKVVSAPGSLNCSESTGFSLLKYPGSTYRKGETAVVSAMSIRCGAPAGPVTVTTSGGESFMLRDDGVSPDYAAGDGVFSAGWAPPRESDILTFASPVGTIRTERIPALGIATTYLPAGEKGYWYSGTIQATGGLAPYAWKIVQGFLPPGLTFDAASGTVSGIPQAEMLYSFTVQATDAEGQSVSQPLSISVGNVSFDTLSYKVWSRMDQLECPSAARSRDAAADPDGNLYVLGYSCREFIRKIGPDGGVEWTRSFSGTGHAITTDSAGNIYITGSAAGSTGPDYFLARYDQDGNETWRRTYDSGAADYPEAIVADDSSGLLVVGNSGGSCFLLRYGTDGSQIWGRKCGAGTAAAVAIDNSGNIAVTGSAEGAYRTTKYDPAMNLLWENSYRGGGTSTAQGIAADNWGNIYVTGYSGSGGISTWHTLKYDPDGKLVWDAPFTGTSSITYAYDIAADRSGHTYVVGNTGTWTKGLLIMYDTNGTIVWKRATSVMEDEKGGSFTPYAVSLSNSGNLYLTGYGPYDSGFSTSRYGQHYAVVTPALPMAFTTGSGYKALLTAIGGSEPYLWTITRLGLPPGMVLDQASGLVSGTPLSSGMYEFTVEAADRYGYKTSRGLRLPVQECPLINATTGANGSVAPSGSVKVPYGGSQSFAVAPAEGYHVADLVVDSISAGPQSTYDFSDVTANHTIYASFGINSYKITATAAGNGTITPSGTTTATFGESRTFTITPQAGYRISDVQIDPGVSVGRVSSYTFSSISSDHWIAARFEPETYTITASAGANGTISPSGAVVAGTGSSATFTMAPDPGFQVLELWLDGTSTGPVYYGSPGSRFTLTNITSDHTLLATFCEPLSVAVESTPAATVGLPYSLQLKAKGGKPPYQGWKIVQGALPPGMNVAEASGIIEGIPATAGQHAFTVAVSDGFGFSASGTVALSVLPPPLLITTAQLDTAYFRKAYTQALSASGGTPPYRWRVTDGTFPCCLSLDGSSGIISGTPYVTGSRSVSIELSDADAATVTLPMTTQVVSSLAVSTATLTNGTVGAIYSQPLSATGGVPPYTWSISQGQLPGGLSLDSTTGTIAGTPATAGTCAFTARVVDDNGVSAARGLNMSVKLPKR